MYRYKFDDETGGILLTDTEEQLSKEPRPIFAEEMNILGFDRRWQYQNQNDVPYLWAESGNSMCVSPKTTINADFGNACLTKSNNTTESLPPLNAT